MKKLLLTLLGVLTMVPAFALHFEYTYQGQTITYTVIDENAQTCEVASYQDNRIEGDLILPSNPENNGLEYTLISISDWAFKQTGISSVTIPESVKSIGYYAFYGCNGLNKAEFSSIEHLCSIKF
ncbi:MAG: leucine-rich repeat domain-containing protein, partial [Muribaculaceae bacterium]|nr:leucine-rich repeat domain-containing protein [Muribaculaceae bacterium]